MVIVGSEALQREDGGEVMRLVQKIASNLRQVALGKSDGRNCVSIISKLVPLKKR